MFDSLIHLQDSQTRLSTTSVCDSLIHLFTYKTLKHVVAHFYYVFRLIHLFTYKTLKPQIIKMAFSPS